MSTSAFPHPWTPELSPTTHHPSTTNPSAISYLTTTSCNPTTSLNNPAMQLPTTTTQTPPHLQSSMAPNPQNVSQTSTLLSLPNLQTTPASQAEQITELLIRIAVLETSLSHAKAERDAVSNSLGIVINSLTRLHTSHPPSHSHICHGPNCGVDTVDVGRGRKEEQVNGLDREIEQLRKENKALRRQVRGQDGSLVSKFWGREVDLSSDRVIGGFRAGTPVQPTSTVSSCIQKGKEREKPGFDSGKEVGIALEAQQFIGSWSNPIASPSASQPVANHNQSFDSGSTTVPNTPLLPSNNTSFADVGIHSLEESIDGFPSVVSFDQNGKAGGGNGRERDGKEWDKDEQLGEQRGTMAKSCDLQRPGVLKVGFEGQGRRGEKYDFLTCKARDYSRFEHPSLPKDASQLSLFFEQHLSKENCEENGQGFNRAGGLAVWLSPEEREDAIRLYQRMLGPTTTRKFVDFFRYGIAYLPSKSDSDYFRTISISNLPSTISIRDVLARVRGGEIVSATLLNTISLTGGKTALVQFVHESAAAEYSSYVQDHPIVFSDAKVPAHISLIQTPTWPLSLPSRRRIHEQKQTRCLFISHFPAGTDLQNLVKHLAYGNTFRATSLIGVEMDVEGTIWLEFTSSNVAGAAFGILKNRASYADLLFGYAEDPCARPLEELLFPPEQKAGLVAVAEWTADEELKIKCRQCGYEFEKNNRLDMHLREVHGIGGFKGLGFEGGGGSVGGELIEMQRKRLDALPNQKIEMPSFSGKTIEGTSWADEVIEEAESTCTPALSSPTALIAPPNSPAHDPATWAKGREERGIRNAATINNMSQIIFQGHNNWCEDSGLRKAPVSLVGSKNAGLNPEIEHLGEILRFDGRQNSSTPNSPPDLSISGSTTSEPNAIFASTKSHSSSSFPKNDILEDENNNHPHSPTRQEIALHRLALLDSQAPVPMSLPFKSKNSNLRVDNSPPRVKLCDMLASPDEGSEGSSSPLSNSGGTEVVRMPHGPGESGFKGEKWKKGEGGFKMSEGRKAGIPEAASGESHLNCDEIFLDDGDEIE